MLLNAQKQPGTPLHVQPAAASPSPTSPLSNFMFNTIGQEPALLKRMSSVEESLQYPPSPSSTTSDHPIPDAASLSRPTLYELLVGKNAGGSLPVAAEATTDSSSNFLPTATETITRVNPLDESGFVSNFAAKNGLGAGPSASSSYPSGRSIYPSSSSIAGGNAPAPYAASSSRHSSIGASVTRADSVLSYIESPVSLDTSHAAVSARPESNGDRPRVPSQPHSSATPSASPSDLVLIISQVAIERADWNELKAMTERFQEEHAEYMRRNEEAVLALQREKEQLTKVLATVTSAFAKLDPLRVKQEKRFDAEQQKAERAFAHRLSEEKRREEAAELDRREVEAAESRKLAAERARQLELEEAARLAREEEDKRRAAVVENRRKAAEEANRKADAEEERLQAAAAAAAKRAEDDRRSAQEAAKRAQVEEAERRQLLDEQRKTDKLKQELAIAKAKEESLAASEKAAKDAADARRLAEYEAQKAAVQEMKRKATEANAFAAQEEKKARLAKEELQARLEKERKEAQSRTLDVPAPNALNESPAAQPTTRGSTSTVPAIHQPFSSGVRVPSGLPSIPTPPPSISPETPENARENAPLIFQPMPPQKPTGSSGSIQAVPGVDKAKAQRSKSQAQKNRSAHASDIQKAPIQAALSQIKPEPQTPRCVSDISVKPENFTPILPKTLKMADKPGWSNGQTDDAEPLMIKREESVELPMSQSSAFPVPSQRSTIGGDDARVPAQGQSVPPPPATRKGRKQAALQSAVVPRPGSNIALAASPSYEQADASRIGPSDGPQLLQRVPRDQAESHTTHIDPMTNVGPWTSAPRTPEEDELRDYARTPPIDDLPGRPAYDHYSPTPPPYAAPARREYDYYSPTPNRPMRSREKSPAPGRKRVRDYDPALGSNEEPLVRRARFSPPRDYPEYGGTTPPRGRSPIPPYQRTYNVRTPSPDVDQYRNDPYRRGYAEPIPQVHSHYQDRRTAHAYPNAYDRHQESFPPVDYPDDRRRVVSGPPATTEAARHPVHRNREQATQNTPGTQRTADDGQQSTLLWRISDAPQSRGGAPARGNRNANASRGTTQRGRGAASSGRARGGNASSRGGSRQQRSLVDRLGNGLDLGARLS